MSLDLDGKVQAGLGRLCEWHNIKVQDVAAQAKWQGGVTERQIGWFKGIWERVVHDMHVQEDEAELAGTMVCAAKNELRKRCGHSPVQWVFGRSPRTPDDLCDPDSGEAVTWDLTKDSKFQRAVAMRTSARVAFHQAQGDDRLRRGLLQRARVAKATYEIGDPVHFWNQPKDRRRPHWTGPAVVVGKQGNSYWISRGGRCRLTAPEHLRSSGPEEIGEYLTMKGVKTEVEKLLAMDVDDPTVFVDEEDSIGQDYREAQKRANDGVEHLSDYELTEPDVEMDAPLTLDPEGDHEMDEEPQEGEVQHIIPKRRARKKIKPTEAMLTHKPLTKRGQAKRQEKELKWQEIPDHAKALFKDAEKVQWQEHLAYDALEPLSLNPTAHKPSRTLETRCLDAQCTCRTHTAAVVSGIYPSIEEVHSGTQWLNCQRPSDPSNSGGSPNRAGGRVQQKTEKTRHCSSQAKLQTHARRKSMTVHVLVRVCGTRWPKAQPTPARPDQPYRTQT